MGASATEGEAVVGVPVCSCDCGAQGQLCPKSSCHSHWEALCHTWFTLGTLSSVSAWLECCPNSIIPFVTHLFILHLFTHPCIHSFIQSLIRSFIDSFTHSFIHFSQMLIHSLIHSFINSLIHSSTHPLTHSFTHSFICSLTPALTHSLTLPLIHSLIYPLIPVLAHIFIYSFTNSYIYSLAHSLTHSLIHSFIHLLMHLCIHSFAHSFSHSFSLTCCFIIHSFTHTLIYSLTHSPHEVTKTSRTGEQKTSDRKWPKNNWSTFPGLKHRGLHTERNHVKLVVRKLRTPGTHKISRVFSWELEDHWISQQ